MNRFIGVALTSLLLAGAAQANDPQSCATVRLSDPGWSDITSTNALASVVLEGLGYTADVKTLSLSLIHI